MYGRYYSNHPGRRARATLPHSDPEPDGFAGQLQHRAESKASDDPIQSANATAFARRLAVGINSIWAKDPNIAYRTIKCASSRPSIKRRHSERFSSNAAT